MVLNSDYRLLATEFCLMPDQLGIFVAGANGRMGKTIISQIMDDATARLFGASESTGSPVQGADAGLNAGSHAASVTITPDLERALQKFKGGVVIDFSSPETTIANIDRAVKHKTPIVVGTTGFDDKQHAAIKVAAAQIAVVHAPNMSVGMNLVFKLVAVAAQVMKDDYDIEVFEAHHRLKKDAPSGTAQKIAQILCEATGRNFPDNVRYNRQGITGERSRSEIGMQVLRGGDIVGDHTVFFCGEGERIEIKHIATSRSTFAAGAIRAAKWVVHQKPGLYSMQDVLGLV